MTVLHQDGLYQTYSLFASQVVHSHLQEDWMIKIFVPELKKGNGSVNKLPFECKLHIHFQKMFEENLFDV